MMMRKDKNVQECDATKLPRELKLVTKSIQQFQNNSKYGVDTGYYENAFCRLVFPAIDVNGKHNSIG